MSVDKLKELLAAETAARNNLVEYQNGPLQFVGDLDKLNRAVTATREAVDTWIAQEQEKTDLQSALSVRTRERDAAQRQVTDLDNRLTALTLLAEGLERERNTAAREIDAAIQKIKDWEESGKKLGAALAGIITEKNTLSYRYGIAAARLMEYCERIVDERGQLVESNENMKRFVSATLERAAQVADADEQAEKKTADHNRDLRHDLGVWQAEARAKGARKIAERIRALKGTT